MNRAVLVVCLLAGACGGTGTSPDAMAAADAAELPPDALPVPDATAPDADDDAPALACLGQAPPATAPDPLPIGGTLFSVIDLEVAQLEGALVQVRRRGDGALLGQVTTDDEGRFDLTVTSGGVPVDAYLDVDAAGFLPTRGFPAEPLSGGENALLIAVTADELAAWYQTAGAEVEAGTGTLITAVVDCEPKVAAGATVAVTPAPSGQIYWDADASAWDPELTASTNGFALATGVAAQVTIAAALGDVAYPAQALAVPPDQLTMAVVSPRD